MPYTMTHVLIAEKVLEHIERPVDYCTYILGATAPDAVHASADYRPEMKSKSHLMPKGLIWGRTAKDEEFAIWLKNVRDFYFNNKDKYEKDFLTGYIVHILTDIFACKDLYVPFLLRAADRLEQEAPKYKNESYVVNYYFYKEFSKEKDLKEILSAGKTCNIEGAFDSKLLGDRLEQLFSFEFSCKDLSNIDNHSIITIENSLDVIKRVPDMIIKESLF